jgi:hypothetical protein
MLMGKTAGTRTGERENDVVRVGSQRLRQRPL